MTQLTATQIPITQDLDTNVETLISLIDNSQGFVLTGEGSLSGYFAPPVINQCNNFTELSSAERYVVGHATTQGVHLLLGTGWMEPDGMPYNQVRIYHNGFQGAYSKRLLTTTLQGGGERNAYIPGFSNSVFPLNDSTLAGVLICNDIWATPSVSPNGNPYYVNEYAQQGVRVLFCSVNCNVGGRVSWDPVIYTWHENHLQMYAKTFGMYIVVSGSSLSMTGEPIEKLQCPLGIIGPDGEWIEKLELGQTSCTTKIQ